MAVKNKKKRFYLFFVLIIVLLVMFRLYIYTQNITLKYETVRLKVKLKELKVSYRFLASKLSAEESLAKIESKAGSKLGMYPPENVSYIISTEEGK